MLVVGAGEFVGTLDGASEPRAVGAKVGESVVGDAVGGVVLSTISAQVKYCAKGEHSTSQAPPPKQSEPAVSVASRPAPLTPGF